MLDRHQRLFRWLTVTTGFAGEKIPYAINRYVHETRRLYRTLDRQLANNPSGYVVGDRATIVDIALWVWVTAYSESFLLDLSREYFRQ
jgi:glutathione S-transferase